MKFFPLPLLSLFLPLALSAPADAGSRGGAKRIHVKLQAKRGQERHSVTVGKTANAATLRVFLQKQSVLEQTVQKGSSNAIAFDAFNGAFAAVLDFRGEMPRLTLVGGKKTIANDILISGDEDAAGLTAAQVKPKAGQHSIDTPYAEVGFGASSIEVSEDQPFTATAQYSTTTNRPENRDRQRKKTPSAETPEPNQPSGSPASWGVVGTDTDL
jgi:hypothetical protein